MPGPTHTAHDRVKVKRKDMNEKLNEFARDQLKAGLAQCSNEQQLLFKRMYAKGRLDMDINDVVDKIDEKKLSWALEQVDRTVGKRHAGK